MLTILLTTAVFAQAPETVEDVEVIIPQKTLIDFVGVEVTGETVKPELRIVQEWAPAGSESLIKLRTSFQTEMNHSIDTVK